MRKNIIIIVLLLCMLYVFSGCTSTQQGLTAEPTNTATAAIARLPEEPVSELIIHFIDVGQADAALIQCGDYTMLIDGGNVADSSLIIAYLKKYNIEHIDYMICTQAHEDHVGGLSAPLSVMSVSTVYAPITELGSKAYRNFKQKVSQQNLEIKHPLSDEIFSFGSAEVQLIGPIDEETDNINNTSIVLKIIYGNTSYLFMGDAEREEEQSLINSGFDLNADVLKVGHHGSDTSTSYVFLRQVMPKYAVISVGKDNSYGHPSEKVLSRLKDAGVTVYRTDLQGDIILHSDGNDIVITKK